MKPAPDHFARAKAGSRLDGDRRAPPDEGTTCPKVTAREPGANADDAGANVVDIEKPAKRDFSINAALRSGAGGAW
jgi:hypothetical protein